MSWIKCCGRLDLMNKSSDEMYKNYRLCQIHFDDKCFLNDLKNKLQSNACPNIFIATENQNEKTLLDNHPGTYFI